MTGQVRGEEGLGRCINGWLQKGKEKGRNAGCLACAVRKDNVNIVYVLLH